MLFGVHLKIILDVRCNSGKYIYLHVVTRFCISSQALYPSQKNCWLL